MMLSLTLIRNGNFLFQIILVTMYVGGIVMLSMDGLEMLMVGVACIGECVSK